MRRRESKRETESAVGFTNRVGGQRVKGREGGRCREERVEQKRTAIEGNSKRKRGGLGEGDPNVHTHTCAHICMYIHRELQEEERGRDKGEGEAITKTPGEHPSSSGASSEKFLPFSSQDYGIHGNHVRSAGTRRRRRKSGVSTTDRCSGTWKRERELGHHPALPLRASICRGKTFSDFGIAVPKVGIFPRRICAG